MVRELQLHWFSCAARDAVNPTGAAAAALLEIYSCIHLSTAFLHVCIVYVSLCSQLVVRWATAIAVVRRDVGSEPVTHMKPRKRSIMS